MEWYKFFFQFTHSDRYTEMETLENKQELEAVERLVDYENDPIVEDEPAAEKEQEVQVEEEEDEESGSKSAQYVLIVTVR